MYFISNAKVYRGVGWAEINFKHQHKENIIYKYMQTDKISQMEINILSFNINIPSKMCQKFSI